MSQLRRGIHPNAHLQNAWNKHGEDAFEFLVIEECDVGSLLEREQYHIDSCSETYNCVPVAGSQLGFRHSEESKAKMSAAHAGKKLSDETRSKISDSLIGNKRSAGRSISPEARAKISAALTGREFSPDTRAKLSKSMTGNKNGTGHVVTPEHKAKIAEANRKRGCSPETKAKISASQKARLERKKSENA